MYYARKLTKLVNGSKRIISLPYHYNQGTSLTFFKWGRGSIFKFYCEEAYLKNIGLRYVLRKKTY